MKNETEVNIDDMLWMDEEALKDATQALQDALNKWNKEKQ